MEENIIVNNSSTADNFSSAIGTINKILPAVTNLSFNVSSNITAIDNAKSCMSSNIINKTNYQMVFDKDSKRISAVAQEFDLKDQSTAKMLNGVSVK